MANDVKYCSECGTQVKITAKFCPDCGAKLNFNNAALKCTPCQGHFKFRVPTFFGLISFGIPVNWAVTFERYSLLIFIACALLLFQVHQLV